MYLYEIKETRKISSSKICEDIDDDLKTTVLFAKGWSQLLKNKWNYSCQNFHGESDNMKKVGISINSGILVEKSCKFRTKFAYTYRKPELFFQITIDRMDASLWKRSEKSQSRGFNVNNVIIFVIVKIELSIFFISLHIHYDLKRCFQNSSRLCWTKEIE